LEQNQTYFLEIITEIATIAVAHCKQYDRRIKADAKIKAVGPDITERDNSTLALAVSRVYPAVSELFDREGIDETELLRIVYRMAGENQPPKPKAMKRRPLKQVTTGPAQPGTSGQPSSVKKPQDPGEGDPAAMPDQAQP
jgi:hypothetical protein